jgi:hypothetical protein
MTAGLKSGVRLFKWMFMAGELLNHNPGGKAKVIYSKKAKGGDELFFENHLRMARVCVIVAVSVCSNTLVWSLPK